MERNTVSRSLPLKRRQPAKRSPPKNLLKRRPPRSPPAKKKPARSFKVNLLSLIIGLLNLMTIRAVRTCPSRPAAVKRLPLSLKTMLMPLLWRVLALLVPRLSILVAVLAAIINVLSWSTEKAILMV